MVIKRAPLNMPTDNISYFIAFCIEQYKTAKGLKGEDVAKLFFDKGVDNYLSDNYEVLHTQSHQWLVEEIDEYLNRQGK
ncbi:MAG: DUF3791 domain-containing protein [Candidatus Cryptobacteroides sp.]|nr:DUF3791 domain-containing protein [Candidatus Cryptobacteroides sp.]